MKYRKALAAVFASVALASVAGCVGNQQEKDQTIQELVTKDASLFKKAGFEIVTTTGTGQVNSSTGEVYGASYLGNSTDVCYLLKRAPDNTGLLYKSCVTHNSSGSAIVGLRSVEVVNNR